MASPARTSCALPRHLRRLFPKRRRRRKGRKRLLVVAPLVLAVLATAAWAVDTASGGDVVRNVEVVGRPVGGQEDAELRAELEAAAAEIAGRTVRLVTSRGELETTAGELGLSLDVGATVERVLEAGRGNVVLRPVRWVTSFVSPHDVEPVLRSDVDAAY